MIFKFLTKDGCGTCSRSIFLLKRLKGRYPFIKFRVINIDEDQIYSQYINKVPVVLYQDNVVCEMKFKESLVREFIEQNQQK